MVFGKPSEWVLSTTMLQAIICVASAIGRNYEKDARLTYLLGVVRVVNVWVFHHTTFGHAELIPSHDLYKRNERDSSELILIRKGIVMFESGLDIDETLVHCNLVDVAIASVMLFGPSFSYRIFRCRRDIAIVIPASTVRSSFAVIVETQILRFSFGMAFGVKSSRF